MELNTSKMGEGIVKELNRQGFVVLPRDVVERASHYVPNGHGEPTKELAKYLQTLLHEQRVRPVIVNGI